MKNLLLAAALLLVSAGTASAYSHSVVNSSAFPMRFQVNYKSCSNDTWEMKPGETITWRSGLCCISSLKGNAHFASDAISTPRQTGQVEGYTQQLFSMIGMGSFFNILCTNTNWKLSAEAPERESDFRGQVTLERL